MYQLAGGSIPGSDHTQKGDVLIGKNNHDAFGVYQTPDITIALVGDGCGGQSHSEIGSKLGVSLLTAALEKGMMADSTSPELEFASRLKAALQFASQRVIESFSALSKAMLPSIGSGGARASYSELVKEYFLSTYIGVVICGDDIGFFGLGDGYVVVNGVARQLGPFYNNEPPYLAYHLFSTRWKPEELVFQIFETRKASEVEHFLIGTDGVAELAAKESVLLPGGSTVIGPLSQFWENDQYFTRAGIRKRLNLIQSRRMKRCFPDPYVEDGRLMDDTTLIVGRRLKNKELLQ